MRNVILIFLSFVLIQLSAQNEKEIILLHTNDMHSRLLPFAPNADYTPFVLNDDKTVGGFARMASLIKMQKETNSNVLTLSSGDFLMGTVFQAMERESGFQLGLMKKMGFDIVSIGNHEFDFACDGLYDIICNARKNYKELPDFVLSNIEFSDSLPEDDKLKELFDDGTIQNYLVREIDGVKIGFFALLGHDAEHSAPYMHPAKISDPVKKAQTITNLLRNKEEVDLVVCLSHSGIWKNELNEWGGEDVELARNVNGLDLIVSGHTHSLLEEVLEVNNTLIVQAGANGAFMGRLSIKTVNGKRTGYDYELIKIDDRYEADEEVFAMIEEQKSSIEESVFNKEFKLDEPVFEIAYDLILDEDTCLDKSNLGQFVADAIFYYVNEKDEAGTDFSLAVAGLIRDDLLKGEKGLQTPADLFRICPLGEGIVDPRPGYPISKIFLSAKEIKSVLEVMLIAPSKGTQNFPFWSGIRFKYNPSRLMLDKVFEIQLWSKDKLEYVELDLSSKNKSLYALTANSYILEFISMINDISMGLLNVQPKKANGEILTNNKESLIVVNHMGNERELKEWEALMHYAGSFFDANGNGLADLSEAYRFGNLEMNVESKKCLTCFFANSNGITIVVVTVLLVFVFLFGLLIFWLRKRYIRKKT